MKIFFNDFKKQYKLIKPEIDNAIKDVLNSWWYILWNQVSEFEKEFASKNWSKYCVWVANWLDALKISLIALWIKSWDEIITTSHSAVATTLAILDVWAIPVFVDIDDYYNIDVNKIEEKITSKTKAILPVHIYWQSCDIDIIKKICIKHNLYLVEDCAQSHFTKFKNKYVWNFWDTWCFSFYPTKNLWSYWDAWAIVTNDKELYDKCKKIRNYWQENRYEHKIFGVNSRLDEIQAAILRVQLKYIDKNTLNRNNNSKIYREWLKGIKEISLPKVNNFSNHTYHLFVIECKKRDELMKYLEKLNIPTLIHFPIPIHKQEFLDKNFNDLYLPVLEEKINNILSLPIHPCLIEKELNFITSSIKEFYAK